MLKREGARYSDTLLSIYQTTRRRASEGNLPCQLYGILNPSKMDCLRDTKCNFVVRNDE
jgi:hypothetical protein